jgi:ribulose-5-phosphate 4-epimerase/fuculose-1-phosphate aldolase
MSQAALRFQGQTAYHDYGRAATDPAECARLVKDMADKSVMILRNHSGITTGKTVCEAFIASYYLEKACQFQISGAVGRCAVGYARRRHRRSGGRPVADERALRPILF